MAERSALRVRPGLPIAQVGTWQTALGEWTCTIGQIADAVRAARDPAFRSPIVKIGHNDPRFTDGEINGDGEPAVGYLENLRASSDGRTLIADWVGIPAWLDTIVEAAYPSRSIEAYTGEVPGAHDTYQMVCVGLAILGVTPPAIETLGDLADLYGVPTDVDTYVAASLVAACALPAGGHMPRLLGQVVSASADMNELATAFEKWAEDQPLLGHHCYTRDILTDSIVAMVWDDEDEGRMYRCSWSENDHAFTFGAPERVRPTYEPVPEVAGVAAAAGGVRGESYDVRASCLRDEQGHAVLSARGRDVTASHAPTQETSVPISPALAAALGVSEDADDDTVIQAVESLRTPPPPAEQQTSQEGGTVDTQAPADIEAQVAAAVRRHTEPILASLTTATTELAGIKAERAASTKDAVLTGAVTAGKIRPADRESWAARYDAAADVITEVLASIAPGTAVPVTAAGITGGEVTGGGAFSEADYERHFGAAEKAGL